MYRIDSASLPAGIKAADIIGCGCSSLVALCPQSKRIIKFSHTTRKYAPNAGMLEHEYTIYSRLQHPNLSNYLIRCYEYIPGLLPDKPEILVLEYASNGSLRDLLNLFPYSPAPTASRFKWAIQAATALDYVHSKGVLHGDIKCTNLLFDENNNIKLADFSCATIIGSPLPTSFVVPVTPYEVTHRLPERELSVDTEIFAFGMTLYEIFRWKQPYEEFFTSDQMHFPVIYDLYLQKRFPSIILLGMVGDVILRCWNIEYESIADVKFDLEGEPSWQD